MNPDRLPPWSQEAEMGVLGCLLLDPIVSLPECVSRIGASRETFYDTRHQNLYGILTVMADASKPVDMVSVVEELKSRNQLEAIGGTTYLSTLMDSTPSPANLPYWLEIITEKFQLRRMVQTCTEIVGQIYEGADPAAILDDAERRVLGVRGHARNGHFGIKELTQQAISEIERCHQQQGVISGLSTGLIDLDKMTNGLHPEEVTVIAAYPGNGKTSLAINISEHVAIDLAQPVGIFSLEMSAVQLVLRMLTSRARVNLRSVKQGFLAERDFSKLTAASVKIANSLIFLDDVSALSVQQLRASARRMLQQHAVKLIVVDYIQLVGCQGAKRDQNREQDVSEVSRGLKLMAKELKLPVLALSQLNDDGRLRESRAIGQDADNVWMIEPEQKEEDEDQVDECRVMSLKIRKQRNGPTGHVALTFLKCYTRFESAAKVDSSDRPSGRKPYPD